MLQTDIRPIIVEPNTPTCKLAITKLSIDLEKAKDQTLLFKNVVRKLEYSDTFHQNKLNIMIYSWLPNEV